MSATVVRTVWYLVSSLMALLSVFFVFYTARLLYVTRWLTTIRAGGQGAYVGAIVFPMLALLFGFVTWRCLRAARRG